MLKPIIQRIVIPCQEREGRRLFNSWRIIVEVEDQAAGPFLRVRGEVDEPDVEFGETGSEIFLSDEEEIDELCKVLKDTLRQAQENFEEKANRKRQAKSKYLLKK